MGKSGKLSHRVKSSNMRFATKQLIAALVSKPNSLLTPILS
ncbi:MAG: hypothetical protein OXB86_00055 [Bdellovibrionales bacterium]|nr:hypothetical protein [Bdellovibrionales bacterium]